MKYHRESDTYYCPHRKRWLAAEALEGEEVSSPPSPRPWEERNNPVPYVPKAPPPEPKPKHWLKKLLRK